MGNDTKIETGTMGGIRYEIWLSTDGKHTVRVETDVPTLVDDALNTAKTLYDDIKDTYGLKKDQYQQQPSVGSSSSKPTTPTPTPPPPPQSSQTGGEPDWLTAPTNVTVPACGNSRCNRFGQALKLIPAGVSGKTNRPYPAFYSCEGYADGERCKYRPPKN